MPCAYSSSRVYLHTFHHGKGMYVGVLHRSKRSPNEAEVPMDHPFAFQTTARHGHLLTTLEGLMAIQATDTKTALNQASQLVAETLGADKVDVFLYEPSVDTLIAVGTSNTPMGRYQ